MSVLRNKAFARIMGVAGVLSLSLFMVILSSDVAVPRGNTARTPQNPEYIIKVDKDNKVSYGDITLNFKHEDPTNAVGYCEKIYGYVVVALLHHPMAQPPYDYEDCANVRNRVGQPGKGFCNFSTSATLPLCRQFNNDRRYIQLCNEGGLHTSPPPNQRYKDQRMQLIGPKYHLLGFEQSIILQVSRSADDGLRNWESDMPDIYPSVYLECEAVPCEKFVYLPNNQDLLAPPARQRISESGVLYMVSNVKLPAANLGTSYSFRIFRGGKKPITIQSYGMPDGLAVNEDGYLTGVPKKKGEYQNCSVTVQDSCPYCADNTKDRVKLSRTFDFVLTVDEMALDTTLQVKPREMKVRKIR